MQVGARQQDQQLCLWVADNGSGFPSEMIDYPQHELLAPSNSTQLGLYFAKVIANLHSDEHQAGYLHLRNGDPLGGGVFELHLPNPN